MSDDQEPQEELLSAQQFEDLIQQDSGHQLGKLKDWRVYCKPRGKKSVQQNYMKDIEQVGNFNTLNGFFRLHSAIREPSALDIDTKLMYFLEGCQPAWEQWLESGCLLISVKYKDQKKDKVGGQILDKLWDYLLLSLIGNSLPNSRLRKGTVIKEKSGDEDIVGIILSRREKISLIELWLRSDNNSAHICKLIEAEIWKQLAGLTTHERAGIQIRYKRHKDSFSAQSTMKGSYLLKSTLNDSF